ncbi:MAG: mechanosensitive ion channel family protein [Planctomycetota bacterium]
MTNVTWNATDLRTCLAAAEESTGGGTPLLSAEKLIPIAAAVLVVLIGGLVIRLLGRTADRAASRRWTPERGSLVRKIIVYTGWVILVLTVLAQLGVRLTAILAAAGVAGIAVGFAAQTSLSNVISGIFLSIERPFKVGNMIQIGDTLGMVLSVDLLSVKMRMFDNRFVRIPNETFIKEKVINYSRFPIRRVDLMIGVAYKEDVERVRQVLFDVAHQHPLALEEPEPLCFCWNFNTSSVDLLFVIWAVQDDWLTLKSELLTNIKKRFDQEGIEIPFSHLSLYPGSAARPLPIDLTPETVSRLQAASRGDAGGPPA